MRALLALAVLLAAAAPAGASPVPVTAVHADLPACPPLTLDDPLSVVCHVVTLPIVVLCRLGFPCPA